VGFITVSFYGIMVGTYQNEEEKMNEKDIELIKSDFNNLLKTANGEDAVKIIYATATSQYALVFKEFANNFIINADNPHINANIVQYFCMRDALDSFINIVGHMLVDKSRIDYFNKLVDILDNNFNEIEKEFIETVCKIEPNLTIKKIEELKDIFINKFDDFNKQKDKIITEYDEALMQNGSIDENFNAIHSAPVIAKFLVEDFLMNDLKPEIIQRYKYNGKPFTLNTARKAVTLAKSQ